MEDQGVVVDVDDAAVGCHGLGDLVGVAGGGQAGADVQELADTGLGGQMAHRANEEGAAGSRNQRSVGGLVRSQPSWGVAQVPRKTYCEGSLRCSLVQSMGGRRCSLGR